MQPRTSSAGPLFGMATGVLFLAERPSVLQWLAAVVMIGGLWVLTREYHDHEHTHEGELLCLAVGRLG